MGGAATAAQRRLARPTTTTRRAWCAATICGSTSATGTRSRSCASTAATSASTRRAASRRAGRAGRASARSASRSASRLLLPDQRLTRVRSLPFEQPRFVYYDNRPQRAVPRGQPRDPDRARPLHRRRAHVHVAHHRQLDLKGQSRSAIPTSAARSSAINVDLVAVRYPQAGILWEATPRLSLRRQLSPLVRARSRSDTFASTATSVTPGSRRS